ATDVSVLYLYSDAYPDTVEFFFRADRVQRIEWLDAPSDGALPGASGRNAPAPCRRSRYPDRVRGQRLEYVLTLAVFAASYAALGLRRPPRPPGGPPRLAPP